MKLKQKYEMILFCKSDLKIPSVAEKIHFTEKLFNEIKKSGENPEIAMHHHCCGYDRYGKDYWKHTCWIDVYSAHELNISQDKMWLAVNEYFTKFAEYSRKYPIAYRYYNKKFQKTYIYIIHRPFSSFDYIITIPDKKPKIPYKKFIGNCNRNSVLLSEVIKK